MRKTILFPTAEMAREMAQKATLSERKWLLSMILYHISFGRLGMVLLSTSITADNKQFLIDKGFKVKRAKIPMYLEQKTKNNVSKSNTLLIIITW